MKPAVLILVIALFLCLAWLMRFEIYPGQLCYKLDRWTGTVTVFYGAIEHQVKQKP